MNRIFSSTLAVASVALAASAGFAQMNTPPPRPPAPVTGVPFDTVVSVKRDTNQIVVQNAAGKQRTIRLNDETRIEQQGGGFSLPMQIDDLVEGDRILVGNPSAGGFTPQIQVLGPADTGAGPPSARPPAANPAAPPPGVTRAVPRRAAPTPAVPRPAVPSPAAPAPGGAAAPR